LELARRHNDATVAVARQAVELFARHVREPLRRGSVPDALARPNEAGATSSPDSSGVTSADDGLLQAYASLLPAVNTLVGHHFARTLVKVALDHVEQAGSEEERQAVWDRIGNEGDSLDFVVVDTEGTHGGRAEHPTRNRRPPAGRRRPASPLRRRPERARSIFHPVQPRPSWSARCSTPSPPAMTSSTGP
jgi:hypothetical protein